VMVLLHPKGISSFQSGQLETPRDRNDNQCSNR
jgi:hypothetical protein